MLGRLFLSEKLWGGGRIVDLISKAARSSDPTLTESNRASKDLMTRAVPEASCFIVPGD